MFAYKIKEELKKYLHLYYLFISVIRLIDPFTEGVFLKSFNYGISKKKKKKLADNFV